MHKTVLYIFDHDCITVGSQILLYGVMHLYTYIYRFICILAIKIARIYFTASKQYMVDNGYG